MSRLGHVLELWRYPVSSLGGERMDAAELRSGGIVGDRLWGVAGGDDNEVAAPEKRKRWRPLPNVTARYDGGVPLIRVPDGDWMPADHPEASEAISRFMDFPVSLKAHVPFGEDEPGHVAPRYQRAAIHILTTASMRRLAELVADAAQIDRRRFRPNVVIDTGDAEGFMEEKLVGRRLAIGNAILSVTEPCARCSFTALAQAGLSFEPAVLHQIAKHGDGGFGALCAVERPASVRTGDLIELLDA